MGGSGSGSWHRCLKKDTTESTHSLDVRYLHRRGLLTNGVDRRIPWSYRRRRAITCRVADDDMTLTYRYRTTDGDWEDVTQFVRFDCTPCNYGGERTWFLCPTAGCGHRVAVLYGAGKYFACRRCYRLTYASQQESPGFRLLSKAQNIRKRLGGSPNTLDEFPDKPKHMHWRTYWRLRSMGKRTAAMAWATAAMEFGGALGELGTKLCNEISSGSAE